MNVSLNQVVNSVNTIKLLNDQTLPIKISFKLLSLTKTLAPILASFEEARVGLIKQYGEAKDDGSFQVKEENIVEFVTKLNELLVEDVKVEWEQIDIDQLSEINLSASELANVDWLFKS